MLKAHFASYLPSKSNIYSCFHSFVKIKISSTQQCGMQHRLFGLTVLIGRLCFNLSSMLLYREMIICGGNAAKTNFGFSDRPNNYMPKKTAANYVTGSFVY